VKWRSRLATTVHKDTVPSRGWLRVTATTMLRKELISIAPAIVLKVITYRVVYTQEVV